MSKTKKSLISALRASIMQDVDFGTFTKEFRALTDDTKKGLVDDFNNSKTFGDDTEVVLKLT